MIGADRSADHYLAFCVIAWFTPWAVPAFGDHALGRCGHGGADALDGVGEHGALPRGLRRDGLEDVDDSGGAGEPHAGLGGRRGDDASTQRRLLHAAAAPRVGDQAG